MLPPAHAHAPVHCTSEPGRATGEAAAVDNSSRGNAGRQEHEAALCRGAGGGGWRGVLEVQALERDGGVGDVKRGTRSGHLHRGAFRSPVQAAHAQDGNGLVDGVPAHTRARGGPRRNGMVTGTCGRAPANVTPLAWRAPARATAKRTHVAFGNTTGVTAADVAASDCARQPTELSAAETDMPSCAVKAGYGVASNPCTRRAPSTSTEPPAQARPSSEPN